MICAFSPAKWWLVKVRKVGQDGVICQIVIENPRWDDAEKMIVELLGENAAHGSEYTMHWHHGHGLFTGNLNKTEQVHDGLCC
jgi:hypothetical protein